MSEEENIIERLNWVLDLLKEDTDEIKDDVKKFQKLFTSFNKEIYNLLVEANKVEYFTHETKNVLNGFVIGENDYLLNYTGDVYYYLNSRTYNGDDTKIGSQICRPNEIEEFYHCLEGWLAKISPSVRKNVRTMYGLLTNLEQNIATVEMIKKVKKKKRRWRLGR